MKKNNGFTIIEIITVLVIITLIATMAIAGISGARGRIDNKAYNSKIKLIETAAAQYAKENSERIKEEFGECTKTGGNCDCTGGECQYKFTTTVQELIDLGYYESEVNSDCLVENPKDKNKCFDKEPIEIVIDANNSDYEAHFGKEFDPFDVSVKNILCELVVNGTQGTNGWYVGENNKLVLNFKIDEEKVARYGISRSATKTYNSLREQPLSSTTGVTYYGYVKDTDGNEGSCVIKNVKVDATNPTDPNVELTSDFNVAFNGSKDTYSERVKYSYTVDETEPVISTKYKIPSGASEQLLKVHAFDYAGNSSNEISKKLTVESPVSGTVTEAKGYYCPDGYTCSTTPCKSTSKCQKIEETDTTEIKKYKCELTGKIYDNYSDSVDNCMLHESGTVTRTTSYVCPSGYTCSDSPCKSTSVCRKEIDSTTPTSSTHYLCYIDGEYVGSYSSEAEATQNCKKVIQSEITVEEKYKCPSGYTCSDGENCNAYSTCVKQTSPQHTDTRYDCYINGIWVTDFSTLEEAQMYCSDSEPGTVGTTKIYSCPTGYTCSDTPCKSTSKCKKTTTANLQSTTAYSCPSGDTCSDTPCKSTSKCTRTTIGTYTYTTYCSITGHTYSWGNKITGTNQTSCSEVHIDYDCKSGREGWEKIRCTHTGTKYYWQGACIKDGNRVLTKKRYFPSKTACMNDMNNYTCTDGGRLEFPDSCSSIKYYTKEKWTCNSTDTKTYGPYYCTGSCPSKCPSGYTQSDSRTACFDKDVQGKSCGSDSTCTAKSTRTCTKEGGPTATTKYSCPSGYTCSDSPCKSTSKCKKIDTANLISTTKYTCSLNDTLYDTSTDAEINCNKDIDGTIKENKKYKCTDGGTCSNSPCREDSVCTISDRSKLYKTYLYKCALDNKVYESETSAKANCVTEKQGTVSSMNGYGCSQGYVCSDGENCNRNSTCKKIDEKTTSIDLKYYCSLTDTFYSNQEAAQDACSRNVEGRTTDYFTYQCSSPYKCNTDPCTISSKCQNILTTNLLYDLIYSCSVDPKIVYTDSTRAREACFSHCRVGTKNLNNNKCYALEDIE